MWSLDPIVAGTPLGVLHRIVPEMQLPATPLSRISKFDARAVAAPVLTPTDTQFATCRIPETPAITPLAVLHGLAFAGASTKFHPLVLPAALVPEPHGVPV